MDMYMKSALWDFFLLPKGSSMVRRRIDAKNTVLLNYESHAATLSSQTHKREVGEMETEWGGGGQSEKDRDRGSFFFFFLRHLSQSHEMWDDIQTWRQIAMT